MTKCGRVTGLTLDTGALLALERGDSRVRALLRRALESGIGFSVPAGVVAQSWRGGPLDDTTARAVGLLCGRTGHPDVVDVHVALHAREQGQTVVTSDPDDLRTIDPTLSLIVV